MEVKAPENAQHNVMRLTVTSDERYDEPIIEKGGPHVVPTLTKPYVYVLLSPLYIGTHSHSVGSFNVIIIDYMLHIIIIVESCNMTPFLIT